MRIRPILIALAVVLAGNASLAQGVRPAPETHRFLVTSRVAYRCYGGYDATKVVRDTRTGFICDNKSYEKTLFDKVVPIEIRFEPNPGDTKTLVGSWGEEAMFMGRTFVVALTLSKNDPQDKPGYGMRLIARDSDPNSRAQETYLRFANPKSMSPTVLVYSSRGVPEELSFRVEVVPE